MSPFRAFPAVLLLLAPAALAANSAIPDGDPIVEPSTLECVGLHWIVKGDENQKARITVEYRSGQTDWKRGPDLFRVEKGGNKLEEGKSLVQVPADSWLFAGSIMMLKPDTEYELRLSLVDSDGGSIQKLLKARTAAEPVEPANMRELHIIPGDGGGAGTKDDPFKGLAAANANAKPGDLFIVHPGQYTGTFEVTHFGELVNPIIYRGLPGAILDGKGNERVISASSAHDVWFENLSIRNAKWGLVIHEGLRIVVRRNHFEAVNSGITGRRNPDGKFGWNYVADNTLVGIHQWSDALHGAEVDEHRGIELSGTANVVTHNRVRNFKDGIDMAPSPACVDSDVCYNEVSECLDDGCEMDGSERNCRCFLNRFTNIFQGISVQPVYGGPIYIYRNALYNVQAEPFKLHNSPSGALFIHNTCVKKNEPLILSTEDAVHNCLFRNNLFIGGGGKYCYENTAPMKNCDFDYDGFGGGPWGKFLKWNEVRYDTFDDVLKKAPVYRHAVLVDPENVFANTKRPADEKVQYDVAANDLRLKAGSAAIDAGQELVGFNDGFVGKGPDLGAYELGDKLRPYGPR